MIGIVGTGAWPVGMDQCQHREEIHNCTSPGGRARAALSPQHPNRDNPQDLTLLTLCRQDTFQLFPLTARTGNTPCFTVEAQPDLLSLLFTLSL